MATQRLTHGNVTDVTPAGRQLWKFNSTITGYRARNLISQAVTQQNPGSFADNNGRFKCTCNQMLLTLDSIRDLRVGDVILRQMTPQTGNILILRQVNRDVYAHPNYVNDVPLTTLHKSGWDITTFHESCAGIDMFNLFTLDFQKLSRPAQLNVFSGFLGPRAQYGHWTFKSKIKEPQYSQIMRMEFNMEQLVNEVLYGLASVFHQELNPDHRSNIQKMEVYFIRGQLPPNVERMQGRTHVYHTPITGRPNWSRTTVSIQLYRNNLDNPLSVIHTVIHEIGHGIAPCVIGNPIPGGGHKVPWINAMAWVVRCMNKMPHGPILSNIFQKLRDIDLNWSSVLFVYPYTHYNY